MFNGLKILVIGDSMLDTDIAGDVDRISPESPSMILNQKSCSEKPGGAANTAAAVGRLGAKATLLTKIGEDPDGQALIDMFKDDENVTIVPLKSETRTTSKTRLYARGQQIFRVDNEEKCEPISAVHIDEIIKTTGPFNAVIVSDYAKGCINHETTKQIADLLKGIPIVVDPKSNNISQYLGATHILPNHRELEQMTRSAPDDDALLRSIGYLQNVTGAKVIVKRAEKGAAFVVNHSLYLTPATNKAPLDVRGAGDVFTATFTLATAAGGDLNTCVGLAEMAAGISISKVCSRYVYPQDLLRKGRGVHATIPEQTLLLKNTGLRVGFTNGCFDVFHPGHVHLLTEAAKQCDKLIVAVNSDESVRKLKGKDRPTHPLKERLEMIRAIQGVSATVVFEDENLPALFEAIRPDILFKGSDYKIEQIVGATFVQSYGGKVVLIEHSGQSSTKLTEKTK